MKLLFLLLSSLACFGQAFSFADPTVASWGGAPAAGGGLTGAPGFASVSGTNGLTVSSRQWSLYVDATNANKIAFVGLEWYQSTDPTRYPPTIGGNSMTLLASTNLFDTHGHVDLYYYYAPAAGTLTVSNGWSANVGECSCFALLVTNAPQSSAFETVSMYSSLSTGVTSFTNTVSTAATELVIDVFGQIMTAPSDTYTTIQASQIDRIQRKASTTSSGGGMSTLPTSGSSTNMGWTMGSGTTQMADVAVAIKQ